MTITGDVGQQTTLMKSLLASSLLCQGTTVISQDAIQDPGLAQFVGTVVGFRQAHAALLQPPHFASSRELRWHSATTGQCLAYMCPLPMCLYTCAVNDSRSACDSLACLDGVRNLLTPQVILDLVVH